MKLVDLIRDCVGIAGGGLIAGGASLIYLPVGMIVGGAMLVAFAWLHARAS